MMRLILIFLSCLPWLYLSTSCSNKKDIETIEMESFLPQSNYKPKEISEDTLSEKSSLLMTIFDGNAIAYRCNVSTNFNSHLLDRFNLTLKEQIAIVNEEELMWELTYWRFQDSIVALNAFYNWLDCFGENCQSIKVNESTKIPTFNYFEVWFDQDELFFLAGPNASFSELANNIMASAFNAKQWKYHFKQKSKRSDLEWTTENEKSKQE